MKSNSKVIWSLFVLCCIFLMYSCEDNEVYNNLPAQYGKVDGISINPGRYRVRLDLAPREGDVNYFKVTYWPESQQQEMKSVQIQASSTDTTELALDSLKEKVYNFEVNVIMKDGSSVLVGQPKGRIYGASYEQELKNRKILSYSFESLTKGKTIWDVGPIGLVSSEVVYQSSDGIVKEVLAPDEKLININNFAGDGIAYRSLFIPEQSAIDTFKAAFDTLVIVPKPPIKPFPEDNGEGTDLKPELIWETSFGTAQGILFVGEDPSSMVAVDTLSTGYFQAGELKQNTKYYWRVDPLSSLGFSNAGDVWTFRTKSVEKPTVTGPVMGSVLSSMVPLLTWDSAEDVTRFNIYMGTSEEEMVLVGENQPNNFFAPGVVQGNQTYYFRVDGVGGDLPENISSGDVNSFSSNDGVFVNFYNSGSANPLEGAFNYQAEHEKANTFTEQSFSMFGNTVTVHPYWAENASNTIMQMIHRGVPKYKNLFLNDLFSGWIGSDTRSKGDPLTLAITGLPAGEYEWKSWHIDISDQTGFFNVTLSDANGENLAKEAAEIYDFSSGELDSNIRFDEVPTLDLPIVSNGVDEVKIVFEMVFPEGQGVREKFFVLNGFQLMKKE